MNRVFERALGLVLVTLLLAASGAACGDVERQPRRPNERPVALLVVPPFAEPGDFVIFDGSESSDTDGTIIEYRFAPGDTEEVLVTAEPLIAHSYRERGDYTVTLTVVDDRGGKSSAVASISVE